MFSTSKAILPRWQPQPSHNVSFSVMQCCLSVDVLALGTLVFFFFKKRVMLTLYVKPQDELNNAL